jgi:hypothetical protein
MLKNTESPLAGPPAEPSVGELVHQLFDHGKSYAAAEVDLVKAIAAAKLDVLKLVAILFGAALLFLQAAVTVLCVAIFVALTPVTGAIVAGLIAILFGLGVAAILAWVGLNKLKAMP